MKKRINFCYIIFAFMLFINCQSKNEYTSKLDNTITKHFKAIENRNIVNLLETVDKENISLVLPSGKYSNSFEDYKKVNVDWFADKTWDIDYEIIEKIIKEKTGIFLTKITYNYVDDNGDKNSFPYYLTLVFQLNNGDWKLIFDQNTLIK